jgi:hypothetical protein
LGKRVRLTGDKFDEAVKLHEQDSGESVLVNELMWISGEFHLALLN